MGQLVPATRRVTCGSDAGAGAHLSVGEHPCAWCESVQARRAILAEQFLPVPEHSCAASAEELLDTVLSLLAEVVERPRPDRVVA